MTKKIDSSSFKKLILLSVLMIISIFLFDKPLMRWIFSNSEMLRPFYLPFRLISHFGEGQYYLVPATGLLLLSYWKNKKKPSIKLRTIFQRSRFFLITFLLSAAVVHVFKFIFGRPRPSSADLIHPQGWKWFTLDGHWHSLPSGHAQATLIFALILGHYFPRHRVLLLLWPFSVGMSRVFLTKHFPGDVLAGYLVALIVFLGMFAVSRDKYALSN